MMKGRYAQSTVFLPETHFENIAADVESMFWNEQFLEYTFHYNLQTTNVEIKSNTPSVGRIEITFLN